MATRPGGMSRPRTTSRVTAVLPLASIPYWRHPRAGLPIGIARAVHQPCGNDAKRSGRGIFQQRHGLRLRCGDEQLLHVWPTNSWVQAVGGSTAGNGYVVGGDGTYLDGFVWSQSNQSYVQIPALAAAQGISNNGQLVAGLTQGSTPRRRSTPPRARWSAPIGLARPPG